MRTFITCALSILVAANAALIAQSPATQNATGRVTAVTADSITIQTSTETLTLFVDSSTKVIGKGVGTITGRLKAEGRSAVVADLVQQYDSVRVKWSLGGQGTSCGEIHRREGRQEAVTSLGHTSEGKRARPVSYTHRAVAHFRRTRLVRAAAFALILWLGVDLAAKGVCCQDERMPDASASVWTADCPVDSSTDPGQADACFCCAHVVGPAALHVPPPRRPRW
jgi:hypothetical protein